MVDIHHGKWIRVFPLLRILKEKIERIDNKTWIRSGKLLEIGKFEIIYASNKCSRTASTAENFPNNKMKMIILSVGISHPLATAE